LNLLPWDFWKLTPGEYISKAKGFVRHEKRKMNDLLIVAWYTAYLTRVRDMPALKSLLIEIDSDDKPKAEHRQSDEEMMAICRLLNAAFGGDEIEV